LEDESLAAVIAPWKDSVVAFAISQLKEFKSRNDYQELLELTTIFFGGIPPRVTHFQYPGAVGYIVLAGWREPFFHKDGAVSKPVYNFQKQQEVTRRDSSASYGQTVRNHWSQYICYSYLCEIWVSMSIWNRRSKE